MSERPAYQADTSPGIGPFLGAVLAEKATWRWTFWTVTPREKYRSDDAHSPVAAMTIVLVQLLVPQKPLEGGIAQKVARMDWIGSALSLTMTTCILVGDVV